MVKKENILNLKTAHSVNPKCYNLLLLKTNKKITKGPAVTTRNNERS